MKYFTSKYINFQRKSEDLYLLVNEITLDQYHIDANLKGVLEAFKTGKTLDDEIINSEKTKNDCLFLIDRNILLAEDAIENETKTFQFSKNTYFKLQNIKKGETNKIAFVGVPFGKGNQTDINSGKFPKSFRSYSSRVSLSMQKNYIASPFGSIQEEHNLKNLEKLIVDGRLRDHGDVFIHQFESSTQVYNKIEYVYDSIFSTTTIPFSIGGDHSITYPILKSLSKHTDHFNVLHFDAHTDVYDNKFTQISDDPDFFHHGSFVSKSMKLASLKKYIMLGLRGTPSRGVHEKIEMYPVGKIKKLLKQNQKIDLGITGKTYITFDIDVIDPAYAPATATPVCFGLTPFEVIELLELCLPDIEIVGIDFVEVNPKRDRENITSDTAMNIIMSLLSYIK